ncbi:MAG: 50S ribosomal protein L11 methyltransferase [Saprospiraceae bacterium]|nr:50S ribosomal protein L11 methyltransferase [Candidatus Vicinibacter affinis]MBP6173024.1 50S ribosomal protein L11 methyltransferase [Saprospiraceae bacterium]MBK6570968.1 50S ribosomal protein L11 methyltransferase [Candidatus Vicinibacter affinis]MBK7694969.1 50S ribosomal protein L11 methyltransferase [Candidatus Vicinibacter affinis]MBK7799880.1 50S ribosomal protein L11 methyltransferase [Candidatus Vicinibacter affinis]
MDKYLGFVVYTPAENQDTLIADLYELGFEAFIEEENQVQAFISMEDWDDEKALLISDYLSESRCKYQIIQHDPQDWNAVWESNFKDIIIKDKLHIRADFHPAKTDIEEELLIAPKMAFGTGHHSTTFMILNWMTDQNFRGQSVLDFGCGTGILGIYAKKKECQKLVMVDIEEQAIENSKENAKLNNVIIDSIFLGSVEQVKGMKFDLILANITRNILQETLPTLSSLLNSKGLIIVSGFLIQDKEFMEQLLKNNGLTPKETFTDKDWVSILASSN